MKTRYKIIAIIIIGVVVFFAFPPILSFTCDVRGIYDETCPRISGISGFYIWPTSFAPWPNTLDDCDEICIDLQEPDLTLSKCADEFDKIYDEFSTQPTPACALPTSNMQCEPVSLVDIIRNNEEFNQSKCPLRFEDWAHLSNYDDQVWHSLSPHYTFDMNKVNLDREISFVLEKWGYDNCDSFHVYVITHDEKREQVLHYSFNSICEPKPVDIKYQKFNYDLSQYAESLELQKDQYIIYLYRDELDPSHFTPDHEELLEYQKELAKFYFSSHFSHEKIGEILLEN